MEQIDLFQDQYRTLNDLLEIVEKINPTGGFDKDYKPIPNGYKIEFYKDLAFIVLFNNETDGEERVIDNAVYLKQVGDKLYEIYEIDGKTLGHLENNDLLPLQEDLIKSMKMKEVFINNG